MPKPNLLRQTIFFLFCMSIFVWTAHVLHQDQQATAQQNFQQQADLMAARIQGRMNKIFIAIQGIQGLVATHPTLDAPHFKQYLDSTQFLERFPAVRAIAFTPKVEQAQLPTLIEILQQDSSRQPLGYPPFRINPAGTRDLYFPAVLVEPVVGNQAVFGFDLWAHPARRQAAIDARDTAAQVLSSPLVLSQDKATGDAGVLLITPVYQAGADIRDVDARRQAHIGFIPVGFTIRQALKHIYSDQQLNDVTLSLYDLGSTHLEAKPLDQGDMLFRSTDIPHTTPVSHADGDFATSHFEIAGRHWVLNVARLAPPTWLERYAVPLIILLLGTLVSGLLTRLLCSMIQHWHRTHDKLKLAEDEVDAFFDMAVDMFCVVSFDGHFKQINPAWSEVLKFDHDTLLATPLRALIHPEDLEPSNEAMRQLKQGTRVTDFRNRYRTQEGDYRWLSWRGVAAPDNELIFAVARDVTERMENEFRMQKLAYFDSLTELANRSYFMEQLTREVSLAERQQRQLAIFYIDLDGFKDVNDSLGHDAGDRLLQHVAERLKSQLRASDFAARLGGDEFCILIKDISGDYSAPATAQRLLQEVSKPVNISGQSIMPRASVGIAYYPADGGDTGSLMKAADSAMYSAKNAGKHRYACYQPHMTEAAMQRLQLEQDLRTAIQRNELELYYQPQICLNSGTLQGVEALVRWRHPERGLLLPEQFIETAERLKIMDTLDEWVLNTACQQAMHWHQTDQPELMIAVNISPQRFADPQLIETVQAALTASGLSPRYLELEITETRILKTKTGFENTRALREMGIKVAVDDFGTGYSSLLLLQDLSVNTIKIDRSFISRLADKPESAILLGTIIGSAHAFGARVVAEGVETIEQARILHGAGCDLVQGYYFCRPMPALELPPSDVSLYPEANTETTT